MDQKELYGGSYDWWPPRKGHWLLFKANPLRFNYFDRFIGNWNGVKVLDVGCGGGYISEYLAKLNAVVSATDILKESLNAAREHAEQNDLQIDYNLCTTERLPYGDNTMDSVTCCDVLEHVTDKQRILSEIYRVLKPGGWFFFDTVNKTFWSRLFAIWFAENILRFIDKGTHDWRHFISPAGLRQLLEASGFVKLELAGIAFDLRRWPGTGLPAKITPKGNTAVVYFGAAMKPDK